MRAYRLLSSQDIRAEISCMQNEYGPEFNMPSKHYKYSKVHKDFPVDQYMKDSVFTNAFLRAEKETKDAIVEKPHYFTIQDDVESIKRVLGDFTTRLRRYLNSHSDYENFKFMFNVDYWLTAYRTKYNLPAKGLTFYSPQEEKTILMLDVLKQFCDDTQIFSQNEFSKIRSDLSDLQNCTFAIDRLNSAIDVPVNNLEKIMEELDDCSFEASTT